MIVDNKKAKKRKRGVLKIAYQNHVAVFGRWMQRLEYAESTVTSNTRKLDYFFEYLQSIYIYSIYDITNDHILDYNSFLHTEGLSGTYIGSCIQAIRNFSKYLESTSKYTLPICNIVIEKQTHQPFEVLTKKEVQHLFESTEENIIGMRDHAMLHLLYSCGLRRQEVSNVLLKDIDYKGHLLYVQPGKTRKGRYVPLHPNVTKVLKDYECYARSIINPKSNYFLVNYRNGKCTSKVIGLALDRILKHTTITKSISPHSLRHSIATHLLQQGMEIEYIRQFLGHKSLQTTQMYVRMNYELLYGK